MGIKSRRKAREVALRALYELEVGKMPIHQVLRDSVDIAELPPDLAEFAREVVMGVREHQASIDDKLASLVLDYSFDRVAAVDRNVLRVAAYELMFEETIPPAVTISEAVEIAKKYSTAESGKFVNGVLGRLLLDTPKADWAPRDEPALEERFEADEPETPVEEEIVKEGSEELERLAKIGGWKIRREDRS